MQKLFAHPALRNLLFVALVSGVALGLAHLAARYPVQRDVTHNALNSLEPASVEVLGRMEGPVHITVYATAQDARLGDIRAVIRNIVSLYQRYKSDITLAFVDPEATPEQTRAAGVQLNGEMVIEYAGRSEHLTQINEQTLTNTLLRLAHRSDQIVMYVDGHGERKLDGIANHDLGDPFGAKLRKNGFRLTRLNLALAQEVPGNAAVLVITQPQRDLLPGEVDKVLRHLERGGNLLWLLDPGPLRGLEPLAERLDLLLPPGVIIDPAAVEMNAPPTWALGAAYPPHAITRAFDLITVFPSARPLAWNEHPGWRHTVLVEAAGRGWVSRNAPVGTPVFDREQDLPGPAVIALAMQREIDDREQRVVVVGSGDFLANRFAGNGGNVDLGVNMVNWLAGEEHLITLQPRAAKDSALVLSKTWLTATGIGFLVILPLLLALAGAATWWKRRRA